MRRRDFITLLGGSAVIWPRGVRAQRLHRIGVLMGTGNDAEGQKRIKAVKDGLSEFGWKTNTEIDIRC